MKQMGLDLNVVVALSLAIMFGAVGDILFSAGMKRVGEVHVRQLGDLPPLIKVVFSNACILFGVISMAIYFASYTTALAWVDVSVANPLTALTYLIATIYAAVVLKERVGLQRFVGLLLVVTGAVFVGLSS